MYLHSKGISISREHRKGENIGYTSDKGLIYRIYEELQQLNIKEIKLPFNQWAYELPKQLSEKKK